MYIITDYLIEYKNVQIPKIYESKHIQNEL